MKDWFNSFQKSIQKWKFSSFLTIPTHYKLSPKLFIFFWYTVHPREHIGGIFIKIQSKTILTKIIESPLGMSQGLFWKIFDGLTFLVGSSLVGAKGFLNSQGAYLESAFGTSTPRHGYPYSYRPLKFWLFLPLGFWIQKDAGMQCILCIRYGKSI